MKDVAKAVNELTSSEIIAFMHSGVIELCGFTLTKDDIVVKREFNGDVKKYEACVSDDGSLMIAIDTTCDDELMSELRARSIIAMVQKLRKSAGLVVSDLIDIYYEVIDKKGDKKNELLSYESIEKSLQDHNETIRKRLNTLPLPISFKPEAIEDIANESIEDIDICKGEFKLYLTKKTE